MPWQAPVLQPAWLKAGITSRRKLTGAGWSIPSTLTVALTSTIPCRATIVAVPFPLGTTCPWAETDGDRGIEAGPGQGPGQVADRAVGVRAVTISCRVARRPISGGFSGPIVTEDGTPIDGSPSPRAAPVTASEEAATRTITSSLAVRRLIRDDAWEAPRRDRGDRAGQTIV